MVVMPFNVMSEESSCSYYNKNSLEVISKCTELIKLNNNQKELYLIRALAYQDLNNYEKAIHDYTAYLKLDPQNKLVIFSRAKALEKINAYQLAILDYNVLIELDPNSSNTYLDRGFAKYKLLDYRGAILDFNNSISLNTPDKDMKSLDNVMLAMTYSLRGMSKFHLKAYKDSIIDFNITLELLPTGTIAAEAYYFRGLANLELGNKENGCLDLSKSGEMGRENAYEAIKLLCTD